MKAATGIAAGLAGVRRRIARAAARSGRAPEEITLVGISKTVDAGRIQEAVEAGLADVGENRVQEAAGKIPAVRPGEAGLTWHLVGHLQKNKVRKALELFPWIHSVDSVSLAERIDRIAGELEVRPTVLLEVNLAGEASKHGVAPEGVGPLLEAAARLENLRLAGLMAVPPAPADPGDAEACRAWFRSLAALRDRWRSRGYDLPALSMGMTGDFEIAVEEGATHVRVGRAIFGERPPAGGPAG